MKHLQVRYFAVLREQRGLSSETFESSACSPEDLYLELKGLHGFSLPPEFVKYAVNDQFVPSAQPLREGDVVTFIPPVAGG
jgi:sulfur-carrier protein